jgi:hypothetical protein
LFEAAFSLRPGKHKRRAAKKALFPLLFTGFLPVCDCAALRNVLTFAFFRQGLMRPIEHQS